MKTAQVFFDLQRAHTLLKGERHREGIPVGDVRRPARVDAEDDDGARRGKNWRHQPKRTSFSSGSSEHHRAANSASMVAHSMNHAARRLRDVPLTASILPSATRRRSAPSLMPQTRAACAMERAPRVEEEDEEDPHFIGWPPPTA